MHHLDLVMSTTFMIRLLTFGVLIPVFQGRQMNIVSSLLDNGTYDKRVPPYDPVFHTVTTSVGYKLNTVIEIDEVQETMTTAGYLRIIWIDEDLSWDPRSFDGTEYIYLPQNSVWKPDLVLANGIKKVDQLGYDMGLVVVDYNGTVVWEPFEVFTTKCLVDMTYYPFDSQSCDIMFTIWSYSDHDVVIDAIWSDESVFYKDDNYGNSIWEIESNNTEILHMNDGTFLSFTLNLRRKPGFFLMNILVPTVILSFVSTTVFIVPSSSGEKIGFAVTIFLSYAVFLTIVSSQLPQNSDRLAIVNIYIIIEVALSVLSLIIATIQVRLTNRNDQSIHGIYKAIVNISRCKNRRIQSSKILKIKNLPDQTVCNSNQHEYNAYERENNDTYSWTDVSDAIDVILFWTFVVVNIVVTIGISFILTAS